MKIPQTNQYNGRRGLLNQWRWFATLAILTCLTAAHSMAATVTLVNENFDSYSGAATSFSDLTVGPLTSTDRIRVLDSVAAPDSPSGLGDNGVQLINWDSAPGSSPNCMLLRPNTAFYLNLDPRGGTNYAWEFWMLSSKSGAADRGFRLILHQQGADQGGQSALDIRSGQASTTNNAGVPGGISVDGVDVIQAFNGFSAASGTVGPNSWVTISNTAAGTPAFVTNNVWAHYKIVADAVARTFSFYVNDMVTPVSVLNSLSRPQNLPVDTIRFGNEGNSADDGYTLIDNVSLTVDGTFIDLATGSFTEGFEGYTASNAGNTNSADNDPGGAWVTAETDGKNQNRYFDQTRVQVVDSTVTAPHSGSQCLMFVKGQVGGSSLSWAQATNEDIKVTWWSKVPAAVPAPANNVYAINFQMTLFAWEAGNTLGGDTIAIAYGENGVLPYGSQTSILATSRRLTEWYGSVQGDTLQTFTADTWEEYQLTTDVKRNSYDLVKNPSSTPVVIVKDGQYNANWGNVKKFHTIGFSTSSDFVVVLGGPGFNPPAYVDDITIEPYTNTQTPEPRPYTILGTGPAARFTNYTVLTVPGKTIGGVAVDPRDTNTIVFTVYERQAGAIMKATKVASGNWAVDPTPLVTDLYCPSSLVVETNGTIWFVMNGPFTGEVGGLRRLKAPWNLNTVEKVIPDFGNAPTNRQDQPCDLTFYVTNGVTKLAVLDHAADFLNPNPRAIWVVDPATTTLYQANYNTALVAPNTANLFSPGLGFTVTGIAALPASGELVTIAQGDQANDNGVIAAWDTTTGTPRYLSTAGSGITMGGGIDVDPTTGRIWVSDRKRTIYPRSEFAVPQIVSFHPTTVGAFVQELSFTNSAPNAARPDRNIDLTDAGMRFSQDGKFLVVGDQALCSGGGRLVIFHSEPFVIAPITITSTVRTGSSVALAWTSGGAVNYVVQRSATVNGTYATISPVLTGTQYTDASSPAGSAFYKVLATPQN